MTETKRSKVLRRYVDLVNVLLKKNNELEAENRRLRIALIKKMGGE